MYPRFKYRSIIIAAVAWSGLLSSCSHTTSVPQAEPAGADERDWAIAGNADSSSSAATRTSALSASPSPQLRGVIGDTLSDGQYLVKLERVVEEMELSPYSANIGQRNRVFHVIVVNSSDNTLEFDEVVMFTMGEGGAKHVNTFGRESNPLRLEPGRALRTQATTPQHSVAKVQSFVVGLRRNGQSLGEPLTFDLQNAVFEMDPQLAAIHAAQSSSSKSSASSATEAP